LCLDREALVQGLFDGRAEVGNDHAFAPIYPPSKLALTEVPQRTQDYDKAKQLLADAGFSGGIDVELTTEQFLEIPQYAVTLKEQCKPAGINITLNIQDQTTYYGSGKNQPWLQAPFNITDWGARGSASQTIGPAYLCVSVPKPDLSNSGAWNASYWCENQFDSLVAARRTEADGAGRPGGDPPERGSAGRHRLLDQGAASNSEERQGPRCWADVPPRAVRDVARHVRRNR
jgi:peptide/nickel transport system substrate-binding protein